jgi:hypothetical protein
MRGPSQFEAASQTKIGDQPTSIIAAAGIIAQLAMASIKAVAKLPQFAIADHSHYNKADKTVKAMRDARRRILNGWQTMPAF